MVHLFLISQSTPAYVHPSSGGYKFPVPSGLLITSSVNKQRLDIGLLSERLVWVAWTVYPGG